METFLAGVIIGAVLQRVVLKEQHNVELFNQEKKLLQMGLDSIDLAIQNEREKIQNDG